MIKECKYKIGNYCMNFDKNITEIQEVLCPEGCKRRIVVLTGQDRMCKMFEIYHDLISNIDLSQRRRMLGVAKIMRKDVNDINSISIEMINISFIVEKKNKLVENRDFCYCVDLMKIMKIKCSNMIMKKYRRLKRKNQVDLWIKSARAELQTGKINA